MQIFRTFFSIFFTLFIYPPSQKTILIILKREVKDESVRRDDSDSII